MPPDPQGQKGKFSVRPLSSVVECVIPAVDFHKVIRSSRVGVTFFYPVDENAHTWHALNTANGGCSGSLELPRRFYQVHYFDAISQPQLIDEGTDLRIVRF